MLTWWLYRATSKGWLIPSSDNFGNGVCSTVHILSEALEKGKSMNNSRIPGNKWQGIWWNLCPETRVVSVCSSFQIWSLDALITSICLSCLLRLWHPPLGYSGSHVANLFRPTQSQVHLWPLHSVWSPHCSSILAEFCIKSSHQHQSVTWQGGEFSPPYFLFTYLLIHPFI